MRLMHADTMIWNLLYDQNVTVRKLLGSIRSKGFTRVVSLRKVYVLARNFERDDGADPRESQLSLAPAATHPGFQV